MTSIPLFPLNTVLYPDGYLPLQIFEVRYLDMIRKCITGEQPFGVVQLLDGAEVRQPGQHETLAQVGTLARVIDWAAPLSGLLQIKCMGTERFQIVSSEQRKTGLWMAQVALLPADMAVPVPREQQNVADALGALIRTLQEQKIPRDQMPIQPPYRLDECGWVANRWCELLSLTPVQKQLLLSQENPVLRLELIQDTLSENGLLEE
ncbi:LON peptidase substrate-binding domain-containing protein [Janthinobacterium sp. PC23-8]|uniref:LON peptidase substrate-binding domain-containing protein n=1 Tax=Janthinobacterium sp. PC23-8 TaxID=2012679 RepID=UPI000B96C710|nr:LON peptidase substrate-binding domain-containing protein [Janthinobacterium sp. PC23-8]OYO29278.1 peptidase S16 [Janthinobacterium sp. PC23-8]